MGHEATRCVPVETEPTLLLVPGVRKIAELRTGVNVRARSRSRWPPLPQVLRVLAATNPWILAAGRSPLTCGSFTKRSRQSTKLVPLKGSPPMPTTVDWPRPAWEVWYTAWAGGEGWRRVEWTGVEWRGNAVGSQWPWGRRQGKSSSGYLRARAVAAKFSPHR